MTVSFGRLPGCDPGRVPDGRPRFKPLPFAVDLDKRGGRDLEEPPGAVPGPDPQFDLDRGVAGYDTDPGEIVFRYLCQNKNHNVFGALIEM